MLALPYQRPPTPVRRVNGALVILALKKLRAPNDWASTRIGRATRILSSDPCGHDRNSILLAVDDRPKEIGPLFWPGEFWNRKMYCLGSYVGRVEIKFRMGFVVLRSDMDVRF
jgi:hypothetical protein